MRHSGLPIRASKGLRDDYLGEARMRLPTYGGFYAWEFKMGGRDLNVRVERRLAFSIIPQILKTALAVFGMAYLPKDHVLPHLIDGRLVRVLEDWCPPFSGYHLYYTSRRHCLASRGIATSFQLPERPFRRCFQDIAMAGLGLTDADKLTTMKGGQLLQGNLAALYPVP